MRTPFGLKGPILAQVTPASMQSRPMATQDDGEDDSEVMKDPMITSFQQDLRASTDATVARVDKLADQVSDNSDLEKKFQKERLSVINRETWIAHKPKYRCYKQNRGKHNLVESICCERYEFCVKYIVKNISVNHFKTLSDDIVENIFDVHFHVDKASDYESVLLALAMKEGGGFNRTKIENYTTDFLEALLLNPTYRDPFHGGTTDELLNEIFIAGLQPVGFRKRISKFGTKDIDSTYDAVQDVLPKYQEMIHMGFAQPNSPVVKAPVQHQQRENQKVKDNFQQYNKDACPHCNEPGHYTKTYPFRDECLKCKTKAHKYWTKGSFF